MAALSQAPLPRWLCAIGLAVAMLGAAVPALARTAPMSPGHVFRDCPDCPEMVVIPAGSFLMGSPPSEAAAIVGQHDHATEGLIATEFPQHRVTLAKPFAAGRFEITVAQFAAFVKATGYQTPGGCDGLHADGEYAHGDDYGWRNPGYAKTDKDPVLCINLPDAEAYVAWLKTRTGKPYRLLTEAEWEYAARGGTTTRYWWGDSADDGCGSANMADVDGRKLYPGWGGVSCADGHTAASPVGSYKPNPFGLYDILGNGWEWTQDCWNDNYAGAPVDGAAWLTGDCADRHVRRGGAFDHYRWISRVTTRLGHPNTHRKANNTIRVARDL